MKLRVPKRGWTPPSDLDASTDATQRYKDAHRRKNGAQPVNGLSDNECRKSMVDRRSENS